MIDTTATAQQALALWGMENASLTLIAERENIVYRIDDQQTQQSWALRLHRVGLRSQLELLSESLWMQALSEGGLSIPVPVKTTHGQLCEQINGQWVDLQIWLDGDTLSQHLTSDHYHRLGSAMAQLHSISDKWEPPESFQRPSWDCEGLVGSSPLWGPFWENPKLEAKQISLLNHFRLDASKKLSTQSDSLDYGLIHADLVSDNVLVGDGQLHLIDFDDSGYGYRLFDLATVVLRLQREAYHDELTAALIAGYLTRRALDLDQLDLFLALRACTYIGWIIPRINEKDSSERCVRFIKTGFAQIEKLYS